MISKQLTQTKRGANMRNYVQVVGTDKTGRTIDGWLPLEGRVNHVTLLGSVRLVNEPGVVGLIPITITHVFAQEY